MDERITFGDLQKDDIGLVRQIVLRRLRLEAGWNVIGYPEDFGQYVNFTDNRYKAQFWALVETIIWELTVLGVILPGTGSGGAVQNINLPNFRRTKYGEQVLHAERFIPHDPAGFIAEARAAGTTCLGTVAQGHLEEAVRCFNRICYVASVLWLGVAAEATFLEACAAITPFIRDVNEQKRFEKLLWVKDKHRWIVNRYEQLNSKVRRTDLPDGLDISLKGIYDLIRRQRNELGHPQNVPPDIDKEHAFASFQLFLVYLRDLEAFVEHSGTAGF